MSYSHKKKEYILPPTMCNVMLKVKNKQRNKEKKFIFCILYMQLSEDSASH